MYCSWMLHRLPSSTDSLLDHEALVPIWPVWSEPQFFAALGCTDWLNPLFVTSVKKHPCSLRAKKDPKAEEECRNDWVSITDDTDPRGRRAIPVVSGLIFVYR